MIVRSLCLGLIWFGIGVQAVAPQDPEPYPGQRQHGTPPEGWFCVPKAKDKAHECHCKRMGHATPQDPVCEDQDPEEDVTCTVYCHKDFCRCPVCAKDTAHPRSGS